MSSAQDEIIDCFDRNIFAEEIHQKIASKHNKSSSSFIFGISGDWGEGKTHLLKLLEQRLIADSFQVIWFSPWKFASDKVSLMRRFIRLINNNLSAYQFKNKRRVNLDDFECDQRILKINHRNLGLVTLALIFTLWFYMSKPEPFWNLAVELKVILMAIAIPLVVAVLSRIATFQTTTKAVSAVDQFDDRLRIILERLIESKKKIVVFVDDLDRVTADEAKQVLDALRTFFDKPELTYVVTGDHRTLEGFMGQKLGEGQPDQEDQGAEIQNEEGRRFLKKIFNVYWKMPLPTETQMKTFISQRLTNSSLSDDEKDKLTSWLIRFFDLNARNTERFIEMVDFSINSLERRKKNLEAKTESEQGNLDQVTEVLANKLLLVRALMFQEKAYPLYEKLAVSPDLLGQIEERVDKKEDYSEILTNLSISLGEEQVRFLAEFLPEQPRFYVNGGLRHRLFPFFRLAGEVGLSDNRGVTLEAFEAFIRNGQHDLIASWLKLTPDVDALTSKAKELIDAEPDINIKKEFITTILNSIKDIPDVAMRFVVILAPSIDVIVKGLDTNERMNILREVMGLIDQFNQSTAAQICNHLTFSNPDDFDRIGEKIGTNSAICYANWFITYLDQDILGALSRFATLKGRISTNENQAILASRKDQVIEAFFTATNDQRLQIIDYLTELPDGLKSLQAIVLDRIDSLPPDEQSKIVELVKNHYGRWTWGIKRVKKWLREGQ